ncbi:hypothetical protein RvY_02554-2 [Ramazzottius varieornatus]|uniref:ACB domain-containing protein n=1 Tax=Ramazzottius varieornatus TaxID=947166 RepID=A0A1D1UUN1_RAMVA|nr:hypothetical protein RvY_02554-2 [Ramazzottius varieornatus]
MFSLSLPGRTSVWISEFGLCKSIFRTKAIVLLHFANFPSELTLCISEGADGTTGIMWQRASLLAWRGIVQGQAAPRNVGSAAQRFPQAAALFQQQRLFASRAESFEDAKEKLNTLKEDPGPTVKLKLYGLFKQATTGECNVAKPGMLDMVGKAKWSAWKELGSMSQDDAKQKYIDTVNELLKEQGGDSEDSGSSGSSSTADSGKYETILYREEGKITYITLNRHSVSVQPPCYILREACNPF